MQAVLAADLGVEGEDQEVALASRHRVAVPLGEHLGIMDIVARRNAFGRQVRSFEEELRFPDLSGEPVRAVFIRAPWIEEHGPEVEVLASVDGHPVAARQGELYVISFHPELSDDTRLHEAFLRRVRARLD